MQSVLILCGGKSAEHEVSLDSAKSVLANLDRSRFKVSVLGIDKKGRAVAPERTRQWLDLGEDGAEVSLPKVEDWIVFLTQLPVDTVVFPVLHGPFGEDGSVQGLLECADLAYVGAGVGASSVGMNKILCKRILKSSGLAVLPWIDFHVEDWRVESEPLLEEVEASLSYPMFVKPANMGSSVGVSKVSSAEQLCAAVERAFRYDDYALVEQGIEAREIELSVLGNLNPRVSIAGEIIPAGEFYTYQAKYEEAGSQLLIPASLTPALLKQVQEMALAAYKCLQLEGMARMDFLVDKKSEVPWLNEPNTIPGFTRISMYPKLWEASGVPYSELLTELIKLAGERHKRRGRLSVERD